MAYKDEEINQKIIAEMNKLNSSKSKFEHRPIAAEWNSLKEGYSKKYPELKNDDYTKEAQELLPQRPLTEMERRQQALREETLMANTNVSKMSVDNVRSNDELVSLIDGYYR